MNEASWVPRRIAIKTTVQDASGATIATSGDHQVHPIFELAEPGVALYQLAVLDNARAIEEGVDADVPVDAQNAPTSDFENCKERSFQQRPHPSVGSQKKKEQQRQKNGRPHSVVKPSTKSDQGQCSATPTSSRRSAT